MGKKKGGGTGDLFSAYEDWQKGKPSLGFTGGATTYAPRCYEKHPVVPVLNGLLCGGSCSSPVVTDADVYVALDGFTKHSGGFPWDPPSKVVHVSFPISDGQAPKLDTHDTFKKMVTWLVEQLKLGKKVHVGCMGGHGRTGLVLAAVVAEALGEKDAITWVREKYCVKAVESSSQVSFLSALYGTKTVEGSRKSYSYGTTTGRSSSASPSVSNLPKSGKSGGGFPDATITKVAPVKGKSSLW